METRWGKRFGRYEIIGEVGRGAMGVVYKARDPKIDRFVAVKAIALSSQNPEEQREYRERFFHEAQAAGRLLHPGIVTIFDTGEDPDSHIAFIVMEYIEGQSLDQLLSGETTKLPLDTALLLSKELAEALDHAHGQGVVHRDMKPANVLVTQEGHAKIADFGIAKMNLSYQTLAGRTLGTPAYMSPEQLDGDRVDGRSDLFSLGAILYRMVTGYGPFQGNSATTVCFKVANRDPLRATSLDSELPSELDAIIARAMAKDPAQRYQRGLEFALDLHELRERALSKSTNGAAHPQRADQVLARSVGGATAHSPTLNLSPVSLLGASTTAARQASTFIRLPILPRMRLSQVRTGVVIVTIILGLFAYHKGLPSRRSSQIGRAVTVGVSGESAAAVSEPNATDRNAGKVSDPKVSKAVADSTLDIRVAHRFPAAELSLWIDDQLAYDHQLRGQIKKHWNPFRMDARETETVHLAAGNHHIRVRVRSTPDKYEESATISGSFAKGHPSVLQINCENKDKGMRLALR